MYATMALSTSIASPASIKQSMPLDNLRHHTLPTQAVSFQHQHLSLPKQCSSYQQSAQFANQDQEISSSGQYQFSPERGSYLNRLDCSPARRDYEHFGTQNKRESSFDIARRGCDRSRSCDRYLARSMSPFSRVINTPSPLPRSLSRGSSQSYQSSSADDSGREGGGGASSSGIGLSGSSADSSRRASCCSSGTGSSRLTFHSNALTLVGSNLSRDSSLNGRMQAGTPELTVRDITQRSDTESHKLGYYDETDRQGDESITKASESCAERPQSIDSLENELTCPICLDLFHEPVLLPCAHNLCAGCVEQILNSRRSSLNESTGNRVVFQCPTCREIVSLEGSGISALRRNLTLQNIVDGYRRAASSAVANRAIGMPYDYENSSGEESSASNLSTQSDGSLGPSRSRRRSRHKEQEAKDYVHLTTPKFEVNSIMENSDVVYCQYCDVDPARVAVKTCLTCRAYYCERCLRVTHPRKKPFVNHKLVPATPGSAGTLSAPKSTSFRRNGVHCQIHTQDNADLYCVNCDVTLCKMCSVSSEHGNHEIINVSDWCIMKKAELENQVNDMSKRKEETARRVEMLSEACQQIEDTAAVQEAKLLAECDTLIRIIQERKEAISTKIKETKASRVRKLAQDANHGQQCVESFSSAICQARETLQQENDLTRFFKHAKATSERINQALASAKQLSSSANNLSPPGFFLDFSQEKSLLDKLDILEAPAVLRICDELCTQSHDKITIQWRSPDHRHVDSYELQYAIDDQNCLSESSPDGWMIVPNIKECNYTIHGLQTGTRYVFAVKAANRAGSTRSEFINIKTLGMPFAFDSYTMHKKLRLANHGYTVTREESGKKSKDHYLVPSNSSSSLSGVTGNVAIEGGRHYWEVVVCQSTSFTLGVAYTNVGRFEWIGKNNSSWCLCRSNQEWSVRHDGKEIPVTMPNVMPKKIGVLLDFDSGALSFFDGASGKRLHTFHVSSFKRPLKPAFSLGNKSLTINTGITVPDHLQLHEHAR